MISKPKRQDGGLHISCQRNTQTVRQQAPIIGA
jgi:hypothetical protein